MIPTASLHGRPSPPAARWRAVLAQLMLELRLTLRRGENLLVTLVIPAGALLFFSLVDVSPAGGTDPVDFLLPGVLALAIIATGFVSLGIATAYERAYGVLKRLGATPLSRSGLVLAKVGSIAVIEAAQLVVLVAIAAGLLGWRPEGTSWPLIVVGLALGTATFAGLGLLLAGTLRADVVMALTNAIFLVLMLLGGLIVPLDRLPEPLAAISSLLPAAALADTLRMGFGASGDPTGALLVLAAWAVGSVGAAAALFAWD